VRATGAVDTVKSVVLVAVPPAVVTVILPVVAPVGTVAVTEVAVLVVNVAVVPLNLTAVTPERFVPVMTTLVPTLPLVGENDVIVGTPVTVKLVALFAAVWPRTVTWMGPVVAPAGTVAVIWVDEFTVNVAAVVLNSTDEVPQKFVPVITTLDPMAPLVGANDEMVAAAAVTTVKLVALGVSAPAPSTVIGPVTAVAGTVVVAVVSLRTVAGLVTALKSACVAPVNPEPVIVTEVPTTPHVGVNDVTAAAEAGRAVTSTPTSPSPRANAVPRADPFFGNLTEVPPFLG
jgi:hypothetical protein